MEMRSDTVRHGAIVRVSFQMLLKLLDFEGGTIHRVFTPDDYLGVDYCNVVVEHPDLPPVPDNERLPEVAPDFVGYYGDDGVLIKTKRIYPKKEENSGKVTRAGKEVS